MWESLVQSVLLYAAEIWGCSKKLGPVEQIQVRTGRIFLGVNRRHPKVSVQIEMDMLPIQWEARKRCIMFWMKVLRMADTG